MNILICDACNRVLDEEIRDSAGDYFRRFDLCVECKEKFEKIKDEYNKKDDELQKEREKLYDEYKNKLKEMGIKYEKRF